MCIYFRPFQNWQKIKSGLQLKFPQKYFPRTPPPTCNVWRGHIDLLESLFKICKSHSLPKLYTVKKQRLQKNEFKRTNYYTILKRQNLNFKAYFMFKISLNLWLLQKKVILVFFDVHFLKISPNAYTFNGKFTYGAHCR